MNFRKTLNINSNGHLQIGGVDCVDLVKQYGTPLYVMDEEYIRDVCRAYRDTLINYYGKGNVSYASKAFSCKAIYQIMKEEKMNIDVVSGGEIYTAISAGFDISKAYFHGNNKTIEELNYAISNSIGTIVIDSYDDIDNINNICKNFNKIQNVLIRTNPGVEAHTHSFIQTSKVDSKFGFSIENGDAKDVIQKIMTKSNLHFSGLHCHIGSQIFDKNAFALAVDVMTDFIVELNKSNINVEELNMGGGFGVHYSGNDPKYDVKEYCNYVKLIIDSLNKNIKLKHIRKPYLMIEPGRSIVGEAGITLYSVGTTKTIKDIKKYINVDGGMGDNIRPALYQAEYDAIIANKANEEATEIVDIAGKCCESGDILIHNIKLPEAKRNDIIALFTTGAYNYTMASNYNRNVIPPVVFVKDGKSSYAVKPQTYEDIIRNDVEVKY